MTNERRDTLRRIGGVLGLVVMLGAGCGDDAAETVDVDPLVYASVVSWAAPEQAGSEPDLVYVTTDDESITLDDQIDVIDALAETHDVRFIDNYVAVLDEDVTGQPPIDQASLLGIATVDPEMPHVIRVEIYYDEARIDAFLVTVELHDGAWRVRSPEAVKHEVLVVAS